MTKPKTSLVDKIFRDKDGHIVLIQAPNLVIWMAIAAWLVARFVPSGVGHNTAQLIFIFALLIWSVLEILQGVNWFRRGLGVVVGTLMLVSIWQDYLVHLFAK